MPQLWLEPLGSLGSNAWQLALLSAQELGWGEALPERRRAAYWASRVALRQRLAPLLGCRPEAVPLQAPPGQPPRLLGGAGWLGLSHSGAGLLMAYSPRPIGVDLERSDRPLQARALSDRFFPLAERLQLAGLPEARLREAVLRSWVLKEAAIKWRWRTLAEELISWCFDHERGALLHGGERLSPPWRAGVVGRWRWGAVGERVEQLRLQCAAGWSTDSCGR